MTEDQKSISLILDLLNATRVPRTLVWIESEMKLAGRRCETPTILETMTDNGMLESDKDGLGIRRWQITSKGRETLANL